MWFLLVLSAWTMGCREVEHLGQFQLASRDSDLARALLQRPLDRVQFKAAHNSIDRRESLIQQLEWDPREPFQSGCRGLELDLVQTRLPNDPEAEWKFIVRHGFFGGTSLAFEQCLLDLRRWSGKHENHDPIVVHLDIKSYMVLGDDALFPQKLDDILERCIGRDRVYAPGDLMSRGDAGPVMNLLAGARRGWPTLKALCGRFLFVISGDETNERVHRRKREYAGKEPPRRLAFVDIDQRLSGRRLGGELTRGDRVVVNLHFGCEGWRDLAVRAHRDCMLTRIWVANSRDAFHGALAAGVNVVSTDKVREHSWAAVGPVPYRLREGD